MKAETLTQLERLQLVNQYAILEKLDPENADHWAECKQILREGYTLLYHKIFDPIWDELSREDCKYVMDVLDMYHALKLSFERLQEKEGIKVNEVKFPGFSGNEESHLLCFARKLKTEGRWQSVLENGDLDSHFPTTFRYPPMMEKWKAVEEAYGLERKFQLTKDEIRDIIDEPGRRIRQQRDVQVTS
jgi:uncharacterized protein YfbU (UPF0304 family)